MSTQKQIAANRRNAQKSTGPRSAEGKARSSQNALKSGIDAKAQIIRGESAVDLQALAAEYHARFLPTTPEQRMLVDTLIDCEWLIRRFRKCEAQLWKHGIEDAFLPKEQIERAQALHFNHDYFHHLQRRIDSAHRNYRLALEQLRDLQAAEQASEQNEESADPAPATSHEQTAKPQNGFVPQTPRTNHTPPPDSAPSPDALP